MQRQGKHISMTIEELLEYSALNVFSVRGPCRGVILKDIGATTQLRIRTRRFHSYNEFKRVLALENWVEEYFILI
jgi:hypothetical protein